MIRLILNPNTHPKTYSFHKQTITIGSAQVPPSDLYIPNENLKDIHLQITEEDGTYFVINCANDPFATLNGLPFRRKVIRNQDTLDIGKVRIRFESEPAEEIREISPPLPLPPEIGLLPIADTEKDLETILETALAPSNDEVQQEDLVTPATQDDLDIDFEMLQVEDLINSIPESEKEFDVIDSDLSEEELLDLVREMEGWDTKEELSESIQPESDPEPVPIRNITVEEEEEAIPLIVPPTPIVEEQQIALSISPPTSNEPAAILPAEEQSTVLTMAPPAQKEERKITLIDEEDDDKDDIPLRPLSNSKLTLKDLYLRDLEDEMQQQPQALTNKKSSDKQKGTTNWSKITGYCVAALLFITLGCSLFYMNLINENSLEEIQAAESISDISIALTYAQINHIVPQNQNWSDPDFLRTNLTAVLPPEYPSLGMLDSHGQLTNTPYFIRIYTSSDLSRFLIIAQPAPSLMQWLIPKATVLLDSQTMTLRKTHDLKTINRMLANPTLDDSNANEIATIVNQGDLIPLSKLAQTEKKNGYSPPLALSLIRPNAENYVYNAPRYYMLGDSVLIKAVKLVSNQSDTHDIDMLKQEIKLLSKFPNLVFYSSQGIQGAIQAQKSLAMLDPHTTFLIAYMQFNSDGYVINTHLLIDDNKIEENKEPESKPRLSRLSKKGYISHVGEIHHTDTQPIISREIAEGQRIETHQLESDITHPLFFQLSALSASRQKALQPLNDRMVELLNKQTLEAVPGFTEQFLSLFNQYNQIQAEYLNKILKGVSVEYEQNSGMPLAEFMHYVKTAGLESFVRENFSQKIQKVEVSDATEQLFETQIDKIRNSKNLPELEHQVQVATELVSLDKLPDAKKVIQYQTDIRVATLKKLDEFILSDTQGSLVYSDEGRTSLQRILKSARVNDKEEYDYYINEYDQLKP